MAKRSNSSPGTCCAATRRPLAPGCCERWSDSRRAEDVRLSIVIPSHNRPDLLAACLDSVRRHAPEVEVLVVDDDSPDGCASATARAAGVEVLRLPRRSGFCVAVNAGVAHVS